MYPSTRETGLSGNIALPNSYFGTFAARTPVPTVTRAPVNTYFNANLALPAPRPISTTTAVPVSIPKLPVSKLPVTVNNFGTPQTIGPSPKSPASPAINVSVSGGAGVSPSGEIATESAGMLGGLSDVNPAGLIFMAMAALVVFMESGKKGRR